MTFEKEDFTRIFFASDNIEYFKDLKNPPSSEIIHEKIIAKARNTTESSGDHFPLLLAHTSKGIMPGLFQFVGDEKNFDKDMHSPEIIKLLKECGSTGYSLIITGWNLDYNNDLETSSFLGMEPSSRCEILQIITEDIYSFKKTTIFKINKNEKNKRWKAKLDGRIDLNDYSGKFSGLIERATKH